MGRGWTRGGSAAVLIGLAAPALAATAHNSQAGSWGPNTHQCDPTPYFPAGGCASAALFGEEPFTVGPEEAYRPRPRLTAPSGRSILRPPAED